jgi:hypothetical protein
VNYVDRPEFTEGQLLSATTLQLAVDYPRGELETHTSVAHTSGVVDGMTYDFVPPVSPATASSVYVAPGLAVDDQGRQIIIATPIIVVPDPLAGQAAGNYPAYVWYTEAPVSTSATVMNPCATAGSDIIRESANVGVFLSDAAARAQFPDAVCLGYLGWTGTAFALFSGTTSDVRQGAGVRAYEIVAPEHLVIAHGEDSAPSTFSVKGTLQAIVSDNNAPPVLAVPGGTLVFSPWLTVPVSSNISLGYTTVNTTGNGLTIDLGDDPSSEVAFEGQQTVAITGTGLVSAAAISAGTLSASTNVVVTAGSSTLTLGSTPPHDTAGVTASDTLTLAFGSKSGDEVVFAQGATPVATIDPNALTLTTKNVQIGILDVTSGAAGLGITTGSNLEIRTSTGDLILNPGTQASPPFRLTAHSLLMNQTVSPPVDVTPLVSSGANGSVLSLGALSIAFGTTTASLDPLSQSPVDIDFPVSFSTAPAFFVAVEGDSLQTIFAVATSVSTTSAKYRISRLKPDAPSDGDAATWSNGSVSVTVSWVALGTRS